MVRISLKIFSFLLWLLSFVFFCCGVGVLWQTPKDIEKGVLFRDISMNSAVDFVNNFNVNNGRLPTDIEFEYWKNSNASDNSAIFLVTRGQAPDDWPFDEIKQGGFGVSAWRGDWNEYYSSDQNDYTADNYDWLEGIKGMLLMWLVSIIFYVIGTRLYNQTVMSND